METRRSRRKERNKQTKTIILFFLLLAVSSGWFISTVVGVEQQESEIDKTFAFDKRRLSDCPIYHETLSCYEIIMQDIEEHLERIKLNKEEDERTNEPLYSSYLVQSMEAIDQHQKNFNESVRLYGKTSDETLHVLDEITGGRKNFNSSMIMLLEVQFDTVPPEQFSDINEQATVLIEEYFRYFYYMFYYNLSSSDTKEVSADNRYLKEAEKSKKKIDSVLTNEPVLEMLVKEGDTSLLTKITAEDNSSVTTIEEDKIEDKIEGEIEEEIEDEKIEEEEQKKIVPEEKAIIDETTVEKQEEEAKDIETAQPEVGNHPAIKIQYTVSNEGIINHSQTPPVLNVNKGQIIVLDAIIEGEAFERVLVDGTLMNFVNEKTIEIINSGTGDISIIPNEDWEKALIFTVIIN